MLAIVKIDKAYNSAEVDSSTDNSNPFTTQSLTESYIEWMIQEKGGREQTRFKENIKNDAFTKQHVDLHKIICSYCTVNKTVGCIVRY